MKNLPRFAATGARLMTAAAVPALLATATPTFAREVPTLVEAPDGVGSANPTFRRHFWRGQLNHGTSSSNADTIYDAENGTSFDAEG